MRLLLEKNLKVIPDGNEFNDLIKSYGKSLDNKSLNKKFPNIRAEAKKKSIKLFYQNFWHGLFPARLIIENKKQNKTEVILSIKFYRYNQTIDNIFPFFMGRLIYEESF